MLLKRKLQNTLRINACVFAGLLLMVPTCLAQNHNGTWTQKANIPTARWGASSCELDNKIYVIGGAQSSNSGLGTTEVYDPATDTWDITKTDMPTARTELCVVAVNGKIYAIGGASSHEGSTLGIVEVYDPLTDSWDTARAMPTPRKGTAYGVINNKIYVAGGTAVAGFTSSKILEVYDPETDNWTQKANMLAARYYPQGTVLNDTFYVSGGLTGAPWTGQKTVQQYDPTTDKWEFVTSLKHGRVGHITDVINSNIYAVGGDTQTPVVIEVEEYDPQADTWTVIDTIPSVMISHTSSVYDNEIYLFSGSATNIHNLTLTKKVYSYAPPAPDTSIELTKILTPEVFVSHKNYPNPFSQSTTIRYSIPKQSNVTLRIFDVMGRKAGTLINEEMMPGTYEVTWDARNFPGGVYFYRLEVGSFVEIRRMVLMK